MNSIKQQLDLNTRLFNNVLDGIADAEANAQANEHVNHMKWLAGHLVSARFNFKEVAQFERENPFKEYFSHGQSIDPNVEYPTLERIKEEWNAIEGPISTAFSNLSPEVLAADAPQVPLGTGKMGDFINFLMHHEAYHIGQMGILRKFLGKDAMSYA